MKLKPPILRLSVLSLRDATFTTVPQHLLAFTINKSDDQLVDERRSIWAMHGRLIPTRFALLGRCFSSLFRRRFGSLMRAYQFYEVHPESRGPVRTEKGAFRAVAILGQQ